LRDLREIAAVGNRVGGGAPAVLATVVKVVGSAYRGAGARLLVLPDGTTAGGVSGGCLERDVVAHAERVSASGKPALICYDLSADEGPWGLGMRCGGTLEVLLEPLREFPGQVSFLLEAADRREPAVLVTVFRSTGEGAPPLGAFLMLGADGSVSGPLARTVLGAVALADARQAMAEQRTFGRIHSLPGGGGGGDGDDGGVEVLVEFVLPPIRLVVGGHERETRALALLAEGLGWDVRAFGRREDPPALDARSAAVLMTHDDARDRDLLPVLLASPAPYVGLLGSRSRTGRLLDQLRERGALAAGPPPPALHTPAGLDIGAETPAEVALAIAAEIQAVFAGRGGGSLRETKGSIHAGR